MHTSTCTRPALPSMMSKKTYTASYQRNCRVLTGSCHLKTIAGASADLCCRPIMLSSRIGCYLIFMHCAQRALAEQLNRCCWGTVTRTAASPGHNIFRHDPSYLLPLQVAAGALTAAAVKLLCMKRTAPHPSLPVLTHCQGAILIPCCFQCSCSFTLGSLLLDLQSSPILLPAFLIMYCPAPEICTAACALQNG